MSDRIVAACRLSRDALIVVARCSPAPRLRGAGGERTTGGWPRARWISCDEPAGDAALAVVAATLDEPLESRDALSIELDGRQLPEVPIGHIEQPLRTVLRDYLAPLPPLDRERVVALAAPLLQVRSGDGLSVGTAKALQHIGDALRERLPQSPAGRYRARLDHILRIDADTYYLRGWIHDPRGEVVAVTAGSPEGARVRLDHAFRYRRPDVERDMPDASGGAGLIALVRLPVPSVLDTGWRLETADAGTGAEIRGPAVEGDPTAVRELLLRDVWKDEELRGSHIEPALSRLLADERPDLPASSVRQLGDGPADPAVSVIVTVGAETDMVEHQMLQFGLDPEFASVELIYVLADPALAPRFQQVAEGLVRLHDVPMRIAVLSRPAGPVQAARAGASLARGKVVAFLGADVLPSGPGWLGAMTSVLRTEAAAGAVGALLLHEDGTISHAGAVLRRDELTGRLRLHHPHRGLHPEMAGPTRRCGGVSLACLAMSRDTYETAGGLAGPYVDQGEEVGLDLCARIARLGHETWCCADARLFQLGERSADQPTNPAIRHYDEWLLGHRAGDVLSVPQRLARSSTGTASDNGAASAAGPAGPVPARWRGGDQESAAGRPTVKSELDALIRSELAERGIESPRVADLLDPTRSPPTAVALTQLRLSGTRILEVGAGLGEMSRALVRRGAALVDACEPDPAYARLARLLHAYHGTARVSVWDDVASVDEDERFDLLLALVPNHRADVTRAAPQCRAAVVRRGDDEILAAELPHHVDLGSGLLLRARLKSDVHELHHTLAGVEAAPR